MNLYQFVWLALATIIFKYSMAFGLVVGVMSCLAVDQKTFIRPSVPALLIFAIFWTDIFCDQWAFAYYYIGVVVGALDLPTEYGDPCVGFFALEADQEITEDFYRTAKCNGRLEGKWFYKDDVFFGIQVIAIAITCLIISLFFFQVATSSFYQALRGVCHTSIKLPTLIPDWTRSTYDNIVVPLTNLARFLISTLETVFSLISALIQWIVRRLSESCAHASSCRCFQDLIPANTHKSLRAAYEQLSSQLDAERQLLEAYDNRAQKSYRDVATMQHELNQLRTQLATARVVVPVPAPFAATQRITELEREVETKTTAAAKMEAEIQSMAQRLAEFGLEIPSKSLRITELESDIRAQLIRITELEAGNPSKDILIAELNSAIQQKIQKIFEMDLRLREMADQISSLHAVIQQKDNEVASKNSVMASWEQQALEMIQDLNQKGQQVEKQRDDARAESSQWKQECESLRRRAQELETALQAQQSLSAPMPAVNQAQPMPAAGQVSSPAVAAAPILPVATSACGSAPGSSSLSRDAGDFTPGSASRSIVASNSAPEGSSRRGEASDSAPGFSSSSRGTDSAAAGRDQSLISAPVPAALASSLPPANFTFSVAFGGVSQTPPAVEAAAVPDENVEGTCSDLHDFANDDGPVAFENPEMRQLLDIAFAAESVRDMERVLQRDRIEGTEEGRWECWNSQHCTEQSGDLTLSKLSTLLMSHQAVLQDYFNPEDSLAWKEPEEEAYCYCSSCKGQTEPGEVARGEYSLENLLCGDFQEKKEEW